LRNVTLLENPYKDYLIFDKSKKNVDYFEDKEPEERDKKKKGKGKNQKNAKQINFPNQIFGLENQGNTCFMAVVLQCLNGDKKVVDFYTQNYEYFLNNSDKARLSFLFSTF